MQKCPLVTPRLDEDVPEIILPQQERELCQGAAAMYLDEPLVGAGAEKRFQGFRPTESCAFTYCDPPAELWDSLEQSMEDEEGDIHALFWYDEHLEAVGVCAFKSSARTPPKARTRPLIDHIRGPCFLCVSSEGGKLYVLQQSGNPVRSRDVQELSGSLWTYDVKTGEIVVLASGLQRPRGLHITPSNDVFWIEDRTRTSVIRVLAAHSKTSRIRRLIQDNKPETVVSLSASTFGRAEHVILLSDQSLLIAFRETVTGTTSLVVLPPLETSVVVDETTRYEAPNAFDCVPFRLSNTCYSSDTVEDITSGLPHVRRMVACPQSGHILLAGCGAPELDGLPVALLRLSPIEPDNAEGGRRESNWMSVNEPVAIGETREETLLGITNIEVASSAVESVDASISRSTTQMPQNGHASVKIDDLMDGFASSVTVDRMGNAFLCPARGGGLRIFWRRGTDRWRSLAVVRASQVPLPETPRTIIDTLPLTESVDIDTQQSTNETKPEPDRLVALDSITDLLYVDHPFDDGQDDLRPLFLDQVMQLDPRHPANHQPAELGEGTTEDREGDEEGSKSSVAVVLRCRPMLGHELQKKLVSVVQCDPLRDQVRISGKKRKFHFARVYDQRTRQRTVFHETVAPLIDKVLEGFQCTCFAYGPTGSGKTFTMEGGPARNQEEAVRNAGMITRAIHSIFRALRQNKKKNTKWRVSVSHLEVYNEQLYDLLAEQPEDLSQLTTPVNPPGMDEDVPILPAPTPVPLSHSHARGQMHNPHHHLSRPLKLLEDGRTKVQKVAGLTEVDVTGPSDIINVLKRSLKARFTAETFLNRHSSRSHAIFTISVEVEEREKVDGKKGKVISTVRKRGKLSLVDLCGSENIKRSGSVGMRAREASHIGKSLLVLGRVIRAIVRKDPYIPFRDSKLTRLLSPALSGNGYTVLMLNIAPGDNQKEETLNTLKYAELAQGVVLNPTADVVKVSEKTPEGESVMTSEAGDALRPNEDDAPHVHTPRMPPVTPWGATVPIRPNSAWDDPRSSTLNPSQSAPVIRREFHTDEESILPRRHSIQQPTSTYGPTIPLSTLTAETLKRTRHRRRHPDLPHFSQPFVQEVSDWVRENVLASSHSSAPRLTNSPHTSRTRGSARNAHSRYHPLSFHATHALSEIFNKFDVDKDESLSLREVTHLLHVWVDGYTPTHGVMKKYRKRVVSFDQICGFVAWLSTNDPIAVNHLFRSCGYSRSFQLMSKKKPGHKNGTQNLSKSINRRRSGGAHTPGRVSTRLRNDESAHSSSAHPVTAERVDEDHDNLWAESKTSGVLDIPSHFWIYLESLEMDAKPAADSNEDDDSDEHTMGSHQNSAAGPSHRSTFGLRLEGSISTAEIAESYEALVDVQNLPFDLQPLWTTLKDQLNDQRPSP